MYHSAELFKFSNCQSERVSVGGFKNALVLPLSQLNLLAAGKVAHLLLAGGVGEYCCIHSRITYIIISFRSGRKGSSLCGEGELLAVCVCVRGCNWRAAVRVSSNFTLSCVLLYTFLHFTLPPPLWLYFLLLFAHFPRNLFHSSFSLFSFSLFFHFYPQKLPFKCSQTFVT